MSKVNFRAGKYAGYLRAASDADYESTLYFCTDTKQIFKGSHNVTDSVIVGIPNDPATAIEGKLYLDLTTLEVKVKNGAAYTVLMPGYLTNSTEWATADSGKFATIGVIKDSINQAIRDAGVSYADGVVTVGENTATLTGLLDGATYDSTNLRLTISQVGGENIIVDLPKDNFVRSGRYDSETKEIVLVVDNDTDTNNGISEVRIPAGDLVDTYTPDNTNKNVEVTITSDNKVSAQLIIARDSSTATGNILISSSDGSLFDSGSAIKSSGSLTEGGAAIPTESLIVAANSSAIESAQKSVDGKIADAIKSKLDLLATGRADEVVVSTAEGKVALSGTKIGGSTLTGGSDLLATEAAVQGALTWGTLE